MARCPRVISATGIYHIMFRGINRMNIFLDDRDNEKFIDVLESMGAQGEYDIYAYCLMKNHVHLLIKESGDSISRSMKRIGVSYSYYFNKKYDRVGHVFQDRYRSEDIENERYLLACTKYIHNNPVKAGIVKTPEAYKWSSYNYYIDQKNEGLFVLNTCFILDTFSKEKTSAIAAFKNFSLKKEEIENFIDYKDEEGHKEDAISLNINSILNKYGLNIDSFSNCQDKAKKHAAIKELKDLDEVSIRQLSKILSFDRGAISRVK